jgi:putative spermidine/putrescine transport system substrate-binding protein
MPVRHLSRRQFLAASAATPLASGLLAGTFDAARAAANGIVATTYPGTWETAQRQILLPAFAKAAHADATLQPVLALEAVAKISASKANPPFDVVLLDEGPYLAALDLGIFAPLPKDKVKNLANQSETFSDPNGHAAFISAQVVALVYNPKAIATPPTSWLDLWKPEYKGRVGITGLGSSLGTAWMVEIAKLHGGGESNMEPAFEAVKALLPNVGAVAPNPGALATLFQQGQIDISYNFVNGVLPLMQRGVDIAIARPNSGWVMVRNSLHAVANSANIDLAYAYIDTALSAEVQTQMASSPNFLAPTNRLAPFSAELQKIAGDNEALSKLTVIDWKTINPQRSALIERFNKDIRI